MRLIVSSPTRQRHQRSCRRLRLHLLQWRPVDTGNYRLSEVKHAESIDGACQRRDESELPQTFVPYQETLSYGTGREPLPALGLWRPVAARTRRRPRAGDIVGLFPR
jgi:hypothetical protein